MRRTYHRAQPQVTKNYRVNEYIHSPEVFLIDENGAQVGITPTRIAIQMARDLELDLVEVNPTATPPVAKIIDFGQFKYKKEKEAQKQKVHQRKIELKGIRLSLRISQHDLDIRLEQAKKFLEKGNKLKIELGLRGRERQRWSKAIEIIKNFVSLLESDSELKLAREQDLTNQGGRFSIILINKNN